MLPILFEIETFKLYTYPLFMGLAWGSAIQYLWYRVSEKKNLIIYLIMTFILSWIGAKTLFLISIPKEMIHLVRHFNFWTGGGFVFYGGLIAALIGTLLWQKFSPLKFDLRAVVPALCLGHGIGRIGCFLTGCCYGRVLFDVQIPVQLIEAGFLGTLFIFFHRSRLDATRMICAYLQSYALFRYLVEFLRADLIRGFVFRQSTSQFISLIVLASVSLYILFIRVGHAPQNAQKS